MDDFLRALRGAEVGLNEKFRRWCSGSGRARGGDDGGSGASEAFGDGFAHPLGATGDEDALAGEFVVLVEWLGSVVMSYSIMRRFGTSQAVLLFRSRRALTDDGARSLRIARGQARQDRAVGDAQSLNTVDLERRVDDGHLITPHLGGTGLMPVGDGCISDVVCQGLDAQVGPA